MLLSFFFKVLPPRSYLADVTEPLETPTWADWSNVGARFLIKASVKGPAPYQVSFRLFNVTRQELLSVPRQSVSGLSEGDLRSAAHRFANEP